MYILPSSRPPRSSLPASRQPQFLITNTHHLISKRPIGGSLLIKRRKVGSCCFMMTYSWSPATARSPRVVSVSSNHILHRQAKPSHREETLWRIFLVLDGTILILVLLDSIPSITSDNNIIYFVVHSHPLTSISDAVFQSLETSAV